MAFTQAELKEQLFMHQPELFEDRPSELVCLLQKSLYGLRQAAKNWSDTLKQMFLKENFKPLLSDPCVFILKIGNAWCVCSTHVDDIFVLYNLLGKKFRDSLFKRISGEVEVENLGPVSWALKTSILRDRTAGVIKSLKRHTSLTYYKSIHLTQARRVVSLLMTWIFSRMPLKRTSWWTSLCARPIKLKLVLYGGLHLFPARTFSTLFIGAQNSKTGQIEGWVVV